MNPYFAFTLAAAITYLLRSSMTIAGDRFTRSAHLKSITALVTPAVLASMIVSAMVVHHGEVTAPPLLEIAAISSAFAVARRTGNFGLALAVGLPVYWLGGLAGMA
jgi:branched-subunit amino acid transport protein